MKFVFLLFFFSYYENRDCALAMFLFKLVMLYVTGLFRSNWELEMTCCIAVGVCNRDNSTYSCVSFHFLFY